MMQPCWTWPTYGPASPRFPADGEVVLLDPIGGPIAVALAEELGERAILVTQDLIAGNELSRTATWRRPTCGCSSEVCASSVARSCAVRRAAEGLDGLEVDGPVHRAPADHHAVRPSSTAGSASRRPAALGRPRQGTASLPARSSRPCWRAGAAHAV